MLKSNAQSELPSCFGEEFDRTAKECMGGYDPSFTDESGSHVREQCIWMSSCSTRTQAGKNRHEFVPASNLTRPHVPFTHPASSVLSAPRPPYQGLAATPAQHIPATAYQQPAYPQAGFQQMVPVNYGMPQYLTNREPIEGRGLLVRLILEVIRSVGKASGHTIAHFFDVEAFLPKKAVPANNETTQARTQ